MTREEFTKIVDELEGVEGYTDGHLTDSDYSIVETVYTYYPRVNTKDSIAELYFIYGMVLIKDMLPRAERIREFEKQKRLARIALDEVSEKLKAIQAGEECD